MFQPKWNISVTQAEKAICQAEQIQKEWEALGMDDDHFGQNAFGFYH